MKSWKSSAHTQQGYSFENRPMNWLTWLCSVGVGVVGYEAAIEWRSVHEERPSCSTSGGQSDAGPAVTFLLVVAPFVFFFVWEAQSANEVQERQLGDEKY